MPQMPSQPGPGGMPYGQYQQYPQQNMQSQYMYNPNYGYTNQQYPPVNQPAPLQQSNSQNAPAQEEDPFADLVGAFSNQQKPGKR